MNNSEERYAGIGLVEDMLAVPDIIRSFDCEQMTATAESIKSVGKLLMTGEGSSRLFPAKSSIAAARRHGWPTELLTEAGLQSQEYDLSDWAVFALSNSGRTAEVIGLFDQLKSGGHDQLYSLTAFADSKLESLANAGYVLSCGEEHAVAATKSVVEQALFYRALLEQIAGVSHLPAMRGSLADAVQETLTLSIPEALIKQILSAETIYWSGRNDGVAEELTLKTNEITRKSADFMEGTYAVHGIEEVMSEDDIVLWIDPYPEQEAKFQQTLCEGVGLKIIAISDRETMFPTIVIPKVDDFAEYVQMAAGWNILLEVGLALGIDVDKPVRARKVGNDFSS